ncbi:MAG: hypothetical protein HOE90_19685 [Bacteriovoracaceae bacterium]|jgi:hypothetical protein|nr:hypothetical protein [Bacteriovoracaceae bacterium]
MKKVVWFLKVFTCIGATILLFGNTESKDLLAHFAFGFFWVYSMSSKKMLERIESKSYRYSFIRGIGKINSMGIKVFGGRQLLGTMVTPIVVITVFTMVLRIDTPLWPSIFGSGVAACSTLFRDMNFYQELMSDPFKEDS